MLNPEFGIWCFGELIRSWRWSLVSRINALIKEIWDSLLLDGIPSPFFLFSLALLMCLCMCMHVGICSCGRMQIYNMQVAFMYICASIYACGGRVKLWVLIKNCLPCFLSQGLSLGPRAHRLVQCGWPVSPRNLPVSSSSGLSLKPPHLPFCLGARDWIQVFWGLHNKRCTDWYLSSAPHSNVGFVTFCRLYYENSVRR